jgi:hypothetical protein
MEFYSATNAGAWMKLENIITTEVTQVQKAKGHMFSLICGILAQH